MRRMSIVLLLAVLGFPLTQAKAETAAEVALINYKLKRYVHRTGKCLGQEWLATYYWSGRSTASGEHFNPSGLTAAHRRLPFGTILHVSNPHNGRSVTVRVNDRGPFTVADIDLSLGAAKALGMVQSSYVCIIGGTEYAKDLPRRSVRHRGKQRIHQVRREGRELSNSFTGSYNPTRYY